MTTNSRTRSYITRVLYNPGQRVSATTDTKDDNVRLPDFGISRKGKLRYNEFHVHNRHTEQPNSLSLT